jgi:hypothetical protein
MLLNESDREFYFPSVALTGAALTGAIWRAQSTAETIAARSLEVTRYVEEITFTQAGESQLKMTPIDRQSPFLITFPDGRPIEKYELDRETGCIRLNDQTTSIGAFGRSMLIHAPLQRAIVTYHAGVRSDDNDPIARSIKVAIASILNYQVLGN